MQTIKDIILAKDEIEKRLEKIRVSLMESEAVIFSRLIAPITSEKDYGIDDAKVVVVDKTPCFWARVYQSYVKESVTNNTETFEQRMVNSGAVLKSKLMDSKYYYYIFEIPQELLEIEIA